MAPYFVLRKIINMVFLNIRFIKKNIRNRAIGNKIEYLFLNYIKINHSNFRLTTKNHKHYHFKH